MIQGSDECEMICFCCRRAHRHTNSPACNDPTDLHITKWQDGKKRFDASDCLLPRVVAGGGKEGGKCLDGVLLV